jgi:hypothetical protein
MTHHWIADTRKLKNKKCKDGDIKDYKEADIETRFHKSILRLIFQPKQIGDTRLNLEVVDIIFYVPMGFT